MINYDLTRSDSLSGQKCLFTNVVILQKDLTGIFRAYPVSNVKGIGSRILRRYYRKKRPSMMRFATKPKYSLEILNVQSDLQDPIKREHCKLGEEPSTSVLLTSVPAKRLNKVLCILLTTGVILLIKHKKMIGLGTSLGRLLITAMTVSKE